MSQSYQYQFMHVNQVKKKIKDKLSS